jgi:drug/metabolite transporter (DMT)-like permease
MSVSVSRGANNAGRGLVLGLVAAVSFGTSGSFAKSLLESGWSPQAAVTVRISLAALLLAGPALLAARGRWAQIRAELWRVVAFGLLAVGGVQLFFFNAVQTLNVGVALLLEYLGLILVVVWLWFIHGRRPSRWTLLGVVLAMCGLVLVLDLTGGADVDGTGVLWGLAAAVGLAAYFVLAGRSDTGVPSVVMAAGGMVVAVVMLVAAALLGLMPMHAGTQPVALGGQVVPWYVPVLGLGVVAGAIAYGSGVMAARDLGPKVAAFLGLTEVFFATLVAWMLLDELPLAVQLAGGALIVAGVAVVRYEELSRLARGYEGARGARREPGPLGHRDPACLGGRPGGVYTVLRATGPAHGRRDQDPRSGGDHRAGAGPGGARRGGEPPRGP